MKLSENFSLSEFTETSTGLPNKPSQEAITNLKYLVQYVLQPARDKFGPIEVTSGYRSEKVNAAVAYKTNSMALYVNGVLAAQNTTATFTPNVQMRRIDVATGNYVTGKNTVNCAQAAIFPTRLTNAQLAQLTTL